MSFTSTPVALEGPLFVTVIVKTTSCPIKGTVSFTVFITLRSVPVQALTETVTEDGNELQVLAVAIKV